jgi:hypothetical protein
MTINPTPPLKPVMTPAVLSRICRGATERDSRALHVMRNERPAVAAGPAQAKPTARRGERVVRGGRVTFYPAPNHTVRIVGLSDTDEWIAEFCCREADFTDEYVRRMERHVAAKTGVRIAVV